MDMRESSPPPKGREKEGKRERIEREKAGEVASGGGKQICLSRMRIDLDTTLNCLSILVLIILCT